MDVTEKYVNWLTDRDVTRYSDNQYRTFTLEGQTRYVETCLASKDTDLYGIFDDTKHIGNIVITGLQSHHQRAEITYVIGDRDYWGKGVATFAIAEVVSKAKSIYKLKKLYAGLANGNTGSQRALEKNGFVLEGVRKSHLFYNNNFYDQLDYGLILF